MAEDKERIAELEKQLAEARAERDQALHHLGVEMAKNSTSAEASAGVAQEWINGAARAIFEEFRPMMDAEKDAHVSDILIRYDSGLLDVKPPIKLAEMLERMAK